MTAAVCLIAAHVLVPDGVTGSVTFVAVSLGASIAAWAGAAHAGRGRLYVTLIALGITLSTIGDITFYLVTDVFGGELATVSVADVPWLASYVAVAGALFALLRESDLRGRFDVESLIDAGIIAVVASILLWQFVVVDTIGDSSLSHLDRLVSTLYPVFDIVMLVLVVRVLGRMRTMVAVLIAAGAAGWLASDFAYLVLEGSEAHARWLDAGWLAGVVLLAAAALRTPRPVSDVEQPEETIEQIGLVRVSLGLATLLVPGTIELRAYVTGGDDVDPLPMLAATVVLLSLAALRAARLIRVSRMARERLLSRQRRVTAMAANSSDATLVVDADRQIAEEYNLAAFVGQPGEQMTGFDLLTMVAPCDLEEAASVFERSLAAPRQVFDAVLRIQHNDGRYLWLSARLVNLLDDPDVAGLVVNLHDITGRKRAEDELNHQAFHDALTGLANRALFRNRLDHALDRNARTASDPAVIFLDLDGFKMVNDSLGHDAGDELLQEMASRLLVAVRRGDTVGRLGGDEFAILIEESSRPVDEATTVADRVLQALTEPFVLGKHEVTVSASLGIAAGDGIATSADLLRDADVAMYRAKTTGKAKWIVYDPEMRTAAVQRLELENDLRHALDRQEFQLRYQPVIQLSTGAVVGFEALLRWHHPELGVIQPDRFIPLAEEIGLVVPIGRWVLCEATLTAARWQEKFGGDRRLTMAVNLSGRQVSAAGLVADVQHALTASGLDPALLVLEMTETVLISDPGIAATRLHQLRGLGIRLAIDDFGTGYSSLSYLRHFPIDILKIDRSFISAITERDKVPAIVRGLLDLGRTLQLETVAEGVELDVQRAQLQQAHCDLAQGFLFAGPLSPDEAEELLGATPGIARAVEVV